MQVKYTVHYQRGNSVPIVDIWKTSGEMTHPVYAEKHHFTLQETSSEGYLYFNPILKKWYLDHYQFNRGVSANTLGELIHMKRLEIRDRLLVKKKMNQIDFLEDAQLKEDTWKDRQKVRLITTKILWGLQKD